MGSVIGVVGLINGSVLIPSYREIVPIRAWTAVAYSCIAVRERSPHSDKLFIYSIGTTWIIYQILRVLETLRILYQMEKRELSKSIVYAACRSLVRTG